MRVKQKSIKHNFKGLWNYLQGFSIYENIKYLKNDKKLVTFQILIIYFIGQLLRIPTTTKIFESQNMQKLQEKLFHKSFDIDTARYHLINIAKTIKKIEISYIMNDFIKDLVNRRILQRNNNYICKNEMNLIPISIDGSESFRTYNKDKIKKLKNDACTGYTKADKNNHKRLFAKHTCSYLTTLIETKLILGIEIAGKQESNLQKDDCEKNLFIKLISNLRKSTKLDNFIVICDAIYTDTNRMKECLDNKINFLFTLKDNFINLQIDASFRFQEFKIPYKKDIIRVGRTIHSVYMRRVILPDYLNGTLLYVYEFIDFNTKEKEMVVTNVDLPLHDAFYLKHIRWAEENIFNYLTKYCNATHNFVLECKNITTLFQVLAFNIINLYFKHFLKSCVIQNGQQDLNETVSVIRDSLFKMKNYKLLNIQIT